MHFRWFPRVARPDEALWLLSEYYARRIAALPPGASRPCDCVTRLACERIRDAFLQAPDQAQALERLTHMRSRVELTGASSQEVDAWHTTVAKAAELVSQVIQSGSAQVLLAGETDGFRHLCRRCCQQDANFARVRYFVHADRRPLLKVEVSNPARSLYGKCQICEQVLVPAKWVVLVPAGTSKHQHTGGEACAECNKRQLTFLACLYECEEATLALHVPALVTLAAPSARQAQQQALRQCWEQGWYLLSPVASEGEAHQEVMA